MAGEEVTVALLGGGTVGTSVVELLTEHAEDFRERIGAPVRLTAVAVRDASKARPGIPSELITDDAVAVASSGVDIVVELMGCLLYTSPSPRDLSTSRMPSSA